MSLVSDEEYSRIHSHIEFLVDPNSLVLHCDKLKRGEERFPNGGDLMMMFLKEASVQDEKQKSPSLRSANFKKLATRVFQLMQYELEDIEALLNIKYQRKMLNSLLENDPGVHTWLLNYRWTLRIIQHASPYSSLSHNRPTLLPDKDLDEARLYLSQWLQDTHSSLQTPKLTFLTNFEIAEHLFATEHYHDAKTYFKRSLDIFDTNKPLQDELETAKDFETSHPFSKPLVATSIALHSPKRSTLSLPNIHAKIKSFLTVIDAILTQQSNSAFSTLEQLIHRLDTDRMNSSTTLSEITSFILEDNTQQRLPFEFRLQLPQRPSIGPIIHDIQALNLLWRLQHTASEPSLLWLIGAETDQNAVNSLQRYWTQLGRPSDLHKRFCKLMNLVCHLIGDDEVWVLLENDVTNFEIEKRRSAAILRASIAASQTKLDTVVISKEVRGPFEVLTSSRDANELKVAISALAPQHEPELISSILWQRAKRYESSGHYEKALQLYDVLEMTMKDKISVGHFWARFLASLEVQASSFNVEEVKEFWSSQLMTNNMPNEAQMTHLVAFLLNRPKIVPVASVLPLDGVSDCPNYIRILVYLYELLWKLHSTSERLHPAETVPNISVAFSESAVSLDELIVMEREENELVNGLVHRLKNSTLLTTLASNLLISLVFLYRASRIPCEAIQVDRISKSMASVSSDRNHSWVSDVKAVTLAEEENLVRFVLLALSQLLREMPQNSSAAFALGDVYLHKKQYGTAMRYYLLAGAVQHFNFSSPNSDFSKLLPSFIHCLLEAKLYHFAIILHQYAPTVDYQAALTLCTTWGHVFPNEMIPFLFDISIMESLVYAAKRHDAIDKAHAIIELISKPEQQLDRSHKVLELQAYKFFQLLVRQYLDNGVWTG